MKYISKLKYGLLLVITLIILTGNTAWAAEYTVQSTNGILYTGEGAEVFNKPDASTIVATFPGDFPVQVTGVTDNGYFQIDFNGTTFYIYGKALSTVTGTQAHKLTKIDARAALVGNADNGELIYTQNATDRLAPASTTKIMTALLVIEAIEAGQIALDTPVMVSASALAGVPKDASHVSPRLKEGEVMNVITLLQSVLIKSDCHACNVLGELVDGSVEAFVARMNARAKMLGCTETNFVNTSGYPEENHYTNAHSLFLITKEAMKHPIFQAIIAMPEVVIPATNLSGERKIKSTNLLIQETEYYNPYVLGGKTGTSTPSGSCFVGVARNGEKTVITVILGAKTSIMSDGMKLKQQFSETNKLIEIGLAGEGLIKKSK